MGFSSTLNPLPYCWNNKLKALDDQCGTCYFVLQYEGTFLHSLSKIGTFDAQAHMKLKFKNILLYLLWDSKMFHLWNTYYDEMFTLLLHCKRKLLLMFLSWHTTIKVNCNLLQSFPLCSLKIWTMNSVREEVIFFAIAAGHFWGWPRLAVLVPHAGLCNSNLVVGFLVPLRHDNININFHS